MRTTILFFSCIALLAGCASRVTSVPGGENPSSAEKAASSFASTASSPISSLSFASKSTEARPHPALNPDPSLLNVYVYYGDSDGRMKPYIRAIPKQAAVADATLRILFEGPTEAERNNGQRDPYHGKQQCAMGEFYRGVVLAPKKTFRTYSGDEFERENVAVVDFDTSSERARYCLCQGEAGVQQATIDPIIETLKQFSSIDNVIITMNGYLRENCDA